MEGLQARIATVRKLGSKPRRKQRPNRITAQECADRYGKHINTVYQWIKEGRIPFIRVGDRYEFDVPTLDRLDAKNTHELVA